MAHETTIQTQLPAGSLCCPIVPTEVLVDYQQPFDWMSTTSSAMGTLCAFAETMNGELDLNTILHTAIKTTMELTEMDSGAALLLDPQTSELSLHAHINGPPDLVRTSSRIRIDKGIRPQMLHSVLATQDLSEITEIRRLVLERAHLRSLLSIPLLSKDRPQGVIILASRKARFFLAQETEFFTILGRQVGSAIHKAKLCAQDLKSALLKERQAMARQMHDDIAQTLGYLGLRVDEVMEHPDIVESEGVQGALEQMRRAIDRSYQLVRDSIARLSQDIPSHLDLRDALGQIVDEFAESTGCTVEMNIDLDWLVPLPPLVTIQASHIIQEALSNTRKHAQANRVSLCLKRLDQEFIEIALQDNGCGFDPAQPRDPDGARFGLRFMAERAERVNGTFEVESQPGHGTRIVVCLPVT